MSVTIFGIKTVTVGLRTWSCVNPLWARNQIGTATRFMGKSMLFLNFWQSRNHCTFSWFSIRKKATCASPKLRTQSMLHQPQSLEDWVNWSNMVLLYVRWNINRQLLMSILFQNTGKILVQSWSRSMSGLARALHRSLIENCWHLLGVCGQSTRLQFEFHRLNHRL